MELQNSSAIFQRLMDHVLKEDIGERSFLYFDDILGFSKTEEKHKEDVERVLRKLVEADLKGNKDKCIFMEKTDRIFRTYFVKEYNHTFTEEHKGG